MQQKKRLLSMLLLLLLPLLVSAQRRLDLSNYQLVWNDEFDSYSDNPFGTNGYLYQLFDAPNSKWLGTRYERMIYNSSSIGDQEISHADASHTRNNVRITHEGSNGFLNLFCRQQDTTVNEFGTYGQLASIHYTTSYMTANYDNDYGCNSAKGFTYGVFEIRAKLSEVTGDHPAFWMWNGYWQCANMSNWYSCNPEANTSTGTPAPYGPGMEIDIFETTKLNNGLEYFSTIQPNRFLTPNPCVGCATYYNWKNSDPANSFHTYAMAWTPNSITWFIDGNEIRTQTTLVPQNIKMDAILSNYRIGGNSGTYKIDYIRVYRPTSNFFTLHPSGQYYMEGAWSDLPMQQYNNTYNTSHYLNTIDNYLYTPIGKNMNSVDYNNANLLNITVYGLNIPRATAVYTQASYTRFYSNVAGKLYSQDFATNFAANNSITNIAAIATNLGLTSALALEQSTGNLFYQTSDNGLACRYYNNGVYSIARLDYTQSDYPKDVSQDIAIAPANSFHPTRIYYKSLTSNRLCYYEWCSAQSRWFRHAAPYTNVAGNIVISNAPAGKVYYRGTDSYIWNIWVYSGGNFSCNNNTINNWQASPLANTSIPNDCAGNLCLHPDGSRIWYRASGYRLAYIDFATNRQVLTDVKDLSASSGIKVKVNTDGRTELFYQAQNKELKTYYQRKAPTINGQVQWQSATLDVFSSDLSPNLTIFRPTNGILPFFDLNAGFPTQIYCWSLNGGNAYLGAYKKGETTNIDINYYNNCGLTSGSDIDGLVIPPWHWTNQSVSMVEPKSNIKEEQSLVSEISLSPNPTDNTSRLSLPDDWCNSQIRILNSTGQVLQEHNEVCRNLDINLADQANGLYLIYVIHNNKTNILKLLKSQ